MKIIKLFILFYLFFSHVHGDDNFENWLINFKIHAKDNGISENTINVVLQDVKFLPNVIKYDRYQPEFYEDTKTYIDKRVTKKRVKKGFALYKNNKNFIDEIEKKFLVEKELLLSLMAIETNYGQYLGKMDIVSSLATLSFDKRRSDFFTRELLIILKLVDLNLINPEILYGSWAGAFGNFQFMPSTIQNYAVDYDKDMIIDLKSIDDSFASAANYINKIGWKINEPCFKKIELDETIPLKYLNTSAQKIKYKKKYKFYKKFIKNKDRININDNKIIAIVTPDKDIVDNADFFSPAYIVFDNYELILKWNRSLRFALAVCTLKQNFLNEL